MGGIEKVNRAIVKALNDFISEDVLNANSISCYDDNTDKKYDLYNIHTCCFGSKLNFTIKAIKMAKNADIVLVSHINLAFVGILIKFFYPKIKIGLMTHGIEIWDGQSIHKKYFLNICSRLLAVSRFTAEKLKSVHGIKSVKIHVLSNCLDPYFEIPTIFEKPNYLLDRYNLQTNQPVLLTITRISSRDKYKGYDTIIDIIAELKNEFPTIKYLLAGSSDESERIRIRNLINLRNLTNDILLPGFINEQEIIDHFLLADTFVMPSKKEGFGIVFIEAAACGTTVIAGNKDGSVDALLEGKIGELVDPDDKVMLKETMRKTLIYKLSINKKKELSKITEENFSFKNYKSKLLNELQNFE